MLANRPIPQAQPAENRPERLSVRDPWNYFGEDFNHVLYALALEEEARILDGRPECVLPGQQITKFGKPVYAPTR